MKIKDLFLKDIDRSINGVIKVDQQDDANVIQELEEYVVTKEMAKHFADFFEMYEKSLQAPTDKIGIWISGFFGSGKSHFLKILSYLFSDRVLNDKKAIDFFKGKFDDSFKYNEISRLLNQKKTEAILFNIDSKSNVGSKKSKDGIVEVLMKAFNDHLGYCSDLPYLAEIERLMDEDGTYNEFKEYYQSQNNESWEQGRETMAFSNDAFIEALTKVKNISQDSVKEYLRTAKDDYSLSSDKLAKIIKNYIERTNTRVLFMIDEVGQYIGDNTQLMLNLQTVTEDLGRECMGEAWIIVTAQEAIDKIAKETIQGSDFSKIRGRFSTNLSLSSQNTDEVIRKRILEKKTEVTGELESMYEENSASLKNLMSFSQGTSTMKLFNDKEDFAKNYPFVPYQFDLLQKVFEMIRTVGATGAHLSEGERSMLSGFQEAVKTIASEDIGKIVSFDRFYSSLEEFLMSNIKRTINKASELSTIDNEDMKVLKILFMIKHIKEVRPNLENITTLSITEINQNKIQLRESIVKSLEKLEKENLIHKSGEEYDFLTDEEQDVNRQIKQVQIDSDEIVKYYSEIIFKDYVEDKVTVDRHNVFSFNKIIDDHHFSNQRDNFDITLKIITPESSEYSDDYNSIVFRYSGDVSIGIIILKDNDTLRELILNELRTEKFRKLSSSSANSDTTEEIIDKRVKEISKHRAKIKELIEQSILEGAMYSSGNSFEGSIKSVNTLIKELMNQVVINTYTKIDYIKKHFKKEDEIQKLLRSNDIEQYSMSGEAENANALDEIIAFVKSQKDRDLRVTIKSIKDKFQAKPYGWQKMDIYGLVAELLLTKKIKLSLNQDELKVNESDTTRKICNDRNSESIVITIKENLSEIVISETKKHISDVFHQAISSNDQDELSEKLLELVQGKVLTYNKILFAYDQNTYPGKDLILRLKNAFEELASIKDSKVLIEEFNTKAQRIAQDIVDASSVIAFHEHQKSIFDKAREDINELDRDKKYYSEDVQSKVDKVQEILNDEYPYDEIKDLPSLVSAIKDEQSNIFSERNQEYQELIASTITEIQDTFKHIPEDELSFYLNRLKNSSQMSSARKNIVDVVASKDHFEKLKEDTIISLAKWKPKQDEGTDANEVVETKSLEPVKTESITKWSKTIETEEDVEEYLENIRKDLVKYIKEGKKVKLI